MLFINNVYMSHFASVSFCHPLDATAQHKRNELHLPFLKSKSLYFSALIAFRPAQWALLRLQRYSYLLKYTILISLFVTLFKIFYTYARILIPKSGHKAFGLWSKQCHNDWKQKTVLPEWETPFYDGFVASYDVYYTLISTSTPLGSSSFIRASTVLAVEL